MSTSLASTTTMTVIVLFLTIAAFVEGFQSIIHPQATIRYDASFPPASDIINESSRLFYSNGVADPETESVMTSPPIIFIKGKKIIVQKSSSPSSSSSSSSSSSTSGARRNSEEEMVDAIVMTPKTKRKAIKVIQTKKTPSKTKSTEESSSKLHNTKSTSTIKKLNSEKQQQQQHKRQKRQPKRKPHQKTWHQRYNELLHFHTQHGHTLIPQNYPTNPKLGLWVMAQRRQYSLKMRGEASSLTSERLELLEKIGFVWKVDKRGPRGAYGEIRKLKNGILQNNIINDSSSSSGTKEMKINKLGRIENFEKYVIEKCEKEEWSDEKVFDAWRERFQVFQQVSY